MSPIRVTRDAEKCIDCKKCDRICPGKISVSTKKNEISSPECIGCLDCVSICPKNDCLTVRLVPSIKLPVFMLPFLTISIFLLFWLVAVTTGHWHNGMPAEVLRKYYSMGIGLR